MTEISKFVLIMKIILTKIFSNFKSFIEPNSSIFIEPYQSFLYFLSISFASEIDSRFRFEALILS